ncbi:MAG: Rid family hydrolase [Oligoflexus sp.]
MSKSSLISKAYIVSGMPHILLAHEQNESWQRLYDSYGRIRQDIAEQDADLILYFSTQWLSILGYMFQADPQPEWLHVDQNWHMLGSIPYQFRCDTDFAQAYADEVKQLGMKTRLINYRGFPIDTGTIVAQKLLNPDNRLPASVVSCNMYSEKQETTRIGQAASRALAASGKKAIAVLVSNLSNRYLVEAFDPGKNRISSRKDDEWNQKILDLLGKGAVEDVAQCARDFARQANGDMGFKGIWWLNGLLGQSNHFTGEVFAYEPVWGTGAALVGLHPNQPVQAVDLDTMLASEEGSQADLVESLTDFERATRPIPLKQSPAQELAPRPSHPLSSTKQIADYEIVSKVSAEPVGNYPHARRYGDLLLLSGIGPRQVGSKTIPGVSLNEKGEIVDYDIKVQTQAVIENVRKILADAGSCLEKVLDIQVFLTNMKQDFASFNQVYNEAFQGIRPTRTTVEVGALPTPIAVEFKVLARP